ncbi:putative Uncharacterized transposase-like protein [Monocercomonoides exilis]|uniref:putative Uncharacterized transposase-like protein n=1 Tax=Monocercomonoides exilis TaxID=2049356 RepID=UPI00355A76CB|nr:putative Uncharacterized transposase-like protein [Monocercomonoides exilis]|eukprot:MONOS_13580.1-p1 / transcript=MONOS_13580.1 / gene=MONOS_13580 / organism=Monocercomonoides_exilis_PA203 / gene_product=Uncharacterized transposase-like protein HI1328.1 / transcript_product=Uncharacterized transposase-like protein HI1328.1 / location=Mono_scaffold00849:7598-8266(+) / protein_length=222 / sequence_SO=supercontig / SO=protein_coding / is_pseudo=false
MKIWNSKQIHIGGKGKIVEIDEAVWRRRKNRRGRRKEQILLFGGVERLDGGKAGPRFMMIVPNRTKETLLPIILEYIKPETIIMSDEWKAYECLNTYGYEHRTVCHKRNFVDPVTKACTNTIEGLWGTLRKAFPPYGVRKSSIADHLAMVLVKASKEYNFLEILEFVSEYEIENEKHEQVENDSENSEEELPTIDDIINNENSEEETSGLSQEEEKTSDYEP